MSMLRSIKRHLKRAGYAALGLRPDIHIPTCTVESGGQTWTIAENSLQHANIVYSLGLATNIEFDLNLIRDCEVAVHGFDPTPVCADYLASQQLPQEFHFHPWAVTASDGLLEMHIPAQPGVCISSHLPSSLRGGNSINVPCKSLGTIMSELGHNRIDLLKMDIEGSEYEVIADLLARRISVGQLLVEFHHRFENIGIRKTLDAVAALRSAGYRLFHVSEWCEEYAFIVSGGGNAN